MRKIICLVGMVIVILAFVFGIDWVSSLYKIGSLKYLILLFFVLAMCHELMHALASWYFGYFAIPIPILIPPIIGITIGERPAEEREDVAVSLSPLLLTGGGLIAYFITKDILYAAWGGLNAFGMVYDVLSIFKI